MSDLASGFNVGLEGDRERLRLVVDAAPIAIVGVDRAGRIVIANAFAEQLFGYARAELLGQTLDVLFPGDSRAAHGGLVAAYLREPSSRTMGASRSIIGRCKDGTDVPIEVGLSPMALREGTVVLATIVNVGDHRRSELRLRAVIDSSPNALVLIDGAGKITLVNTQAEKLFGYRREELFGQSVEQLVPRRFRNIHFTQRNGFLSAPTARFMGAGRDLFGLCKDGREIPIEIGLNPLQLPHGQFVLAAIIDITERKRGEKLRVLNADFGQHALATSDVAELQQQAVDLIGSAIGAPLVRIADLDPAGRTLLFRAGFGWPDRYIENHSLELAASPQAAESIRSGRSIFLERIDEANPLTPSKEARALGTVASATIPIRGKDAVVGLLHVGVREPRRFSQDDVAFLVGIGTILGMAIDRHRREQRISRLNVELQHQYDELETFSYSVAHDLRAPLRAVAGFASALEEDYGPILDDEAKRFISLIVGGATQMGGLIDALLSLARVSRQEISRTAINLSSIAASIVSDLQLADPERNVIATVVPGLMASGDPALLRNVLANLLSNAWKFTRGRDPARIRFDAQTVDGETAYCVSDNGVGFFTEHPEELFAPFKRLHGKSFEGTGIGLATVARIVHRHGGRVWAHSEPGMGTTMYFTLGEHYQ
jgi:PAS domain S-box-containing protein